MTNIPWSVHSYYTGTLYEVYTKIRNFLITMSDITKIGFFYSCKYGFCTQNRE
jgi:hypothetical protein